MRSRTTTGGARPDTPREFFYQHAGYAVEPGQTAEAARFANSVRLANAERKGTERGLLVDWVPDWEERAESGGDYWFGCVIRAPHGGAVLASLWSIQIVGDDDPYKRVIRAELFAEALAAEEGSK